MCKLEKCCCCIDLPTGAKILGWLGIIGSIFSTIGCAFILFAYGSFIEMVVKEQQKMGPMGADSSQMVEFLKEWETVFKIIAFIALVVTIIELVCCVYLIKGASNLKSSYIKPYLIFDMVVIVFYGLGILGNPGLVVSFALKLYWWICVYSLYKNIDEQGFQGVVYSPPPVQKV